jgi:hypothetical protein
MIPKIRFSRGWWLVPVMFLAACDREEPTPGGGVEAVKDAAEQVVETVTEPESTDVSPAERAEVLGFGGKLSADTELFMSIYDGAELVRSLAKQDLWQFTRELVKEVEGVDPQEEIAGVGAQAEALIGNEMFLALGAGTSGQIANLNELGELMQYYQLVETTRNFAMNLVGGKPEDSLSRMESMVWVESLLQSKERWMPMVESFTVPPVLLGLKIEQADAMGGAEQQLRGLLGMIAEGSEPVEFTKGAATFKGNLYSGELLAQEMAGDAEEMKGMLGDETYERLIDTVKEKQLMITVGKVDDYLLVYIGSSEEACPVVAETGESLVSRDDIGFIDGFVGKPVYGAVYGAKELMEQGLTASLKGLAEAVRDGLQGVEGLGDVRDLSALLSMVGEREEKLLELYGAERLGAVISVDAGARLDLFGGLRTGSQDLEATHTLCGLGESEDAIFFANWVSDPEFSERALDLFELSVEILYAGANHVAKLGKEADSLAEMSQGFGLFDQMLRDKLLKLWAGLDMLQQGLGNEAALLIDGGGKLPAMPGVPPALLEKAATPRVAFIAPVEDRAKLKESWSLIGGAVEALVEVANSVGGMELPVPKPVLAGEEVATHWHFNLIPEFQEGAAAEVAEPMISVSDKWFVAANSKEQAEALMGATTKEHTPRSGAWAKLDLDALRSYLNEMIAMVRENRADVFPSESDAEEFAEFAEVALEGLAASENLDSVTMHERIEQGERRATLHFHVKEAP